jgi:DNA polymerase-3 subunit delta'
MACRLLAAGNHPDYRELQPGGPDESEEGAEAGPEPRAGKRGASSRWIKVEQVRDLADFVHLAPHFGSRKAILILEADRLHPSAANALLKTLEEPPPGRQFLLVTHRPQRILATVRSRCVRLQFALPPADEALAWLAAQGVQDPRGALAWAGGAPLRALELAAPELAQARGWVVDRCLASPDGDPVQLSGDIGADGLTTLVDTMQRWCYDLLLVRLTGTPRYHVDRAQILHRTAMLVELTRLMRFSKELQSCMRLLEHPLNPRLVAESCLVGYRNLFTARR